MELITLVENFDSTEKLLHKECDLVLERFVNIQFVFFSNLAILLYFQGNFDGIFQVIF